ncbi:hypothetical protein K491DRAFT_760619 [Lophiostoma macrostomum CBS 122681]|uniref:Nucleolar protein Dnt1-like N-terminal domain-containing protein n=1 Tax=Lophiostoma macrostomum CBS 122681 TaxID=1314788 RepID=A0A6A6SWD6_9PLEO|nr:hypothetical protein K491DRAFT_760619 [Lophiostoma macrostomum CBS 122681]
MASPDSMIRLTIHVLPLAAENAHGDHRDVAPEAFPLRKFALPVQLQDTLEQVWSRIEERYTRNYLSLQTSAFTIKVLRDYYDCDLDLGDTVGAIFGGEPDYSKRLIKVIPSFVDRGFSVPFTSNLRPASAQKRAREAFEDPANKKRRLELGTQHHVAEILLNGRDRPVPSTESGGGGSFGMDNAGGSFTRRPGSTRRSRTASSVLQIRDSQTGRAEFGQAIKEESPEPGPFPMHPIPDTPQDMFPSSEHSVPKPRLTAAPRTRRVEQAGKGPAPGSPLRSQTQVSGEVAATKDAATEDNVQMLDGLSLQEDHKEEESPAPTPPAGQQIAAEPQSPISSTSDGAPSPEPEHRPRRKDPYELSSTPEALRPRSRPSRTYASSSRTPKQPSNVFTPTRKGKQPRASPTIVKNSSTSGSGPIASTSGTPGKGRPRGVKTKRMGRPRGVKTAPSTDAAHGPRSVRRSPSTSHSWSLKDTENLKIVSASIQAPASSAEPSFPTIPDMTRKQASGDNSSYLEQLQKAASEPQSESSPTMSRLPVRFLSRSPSPNESSSDKEEEGEQPKPKSLSKAVSMGAAEKDENSNNGDVDNDIDRDSAHDSSTGSSDSSDTEHEDEETEDVDGVKDHDKDHNEAQAEGPPSSPPVALSSVQHRVFSPVVSSQPSQLSTSQSLPHVSQTAMKNTSMNVFETPQPLPMVGKMAPDPNSVTATGRRPTYQKFPSLSQQLVSARSTPMAAEPTKPFDPRTGSIGLLTQWKHNSEGSFLENGRESEDESSSSSSSKG